jgi:short-subunit dehydrogenase
MTQTPTFPTRIAITGASSGIGAALAQAYARPDAALVLIGRDRPRLDAVADSCRARGALVTTAAADVAVRDQIAPARVAADDAAPIDLLIVNAGILAGEPGNTMPEPETETLRQIEINLLGAIYSATPVAERMLSRGRGQIAFTASLAAFTPTPDWPGYCASKAALLSYGLSLRERYRPRGVRVSVICPGWVTAPINAPFEMWRPFEMAPEKAARVIVRGLSRNKAVIAFPRPLAWSAPFASILPAALVQLGMRRFKAIRRPHPAPDGSAP